MVHNAVPLLENSTYAFNLVSTSNGSDLLLGRKFLVSELPQTQRKEGFLACFLVKRTTFSKAMMEILRIGLNVLGNIRSPCRCLDVKQSRHHGRGSDGGTINFGLFLGMALIPCVLLPLKLYGDYSMVSVSIAKIKVWHHSGQRACGQ